MQEEDGGLVRIASVIVYVAVSIAGGQLCRANVMDVVHAQEVGLEASVSDVRIVGVMLTHDIWMGMDGTVLVGTRRRLDRRSADENAQEEQSDY